MTETSHDGWQSGDRYERYMGRWSRRIAPAFLDWLEAPSHSSWADIGCGTGALSASILARCDPASIVAIDPSTGFLETARSSIFDARVAFCMGDAQTLPLSDASCDVVASALALNFVANKMTALSEMRRVVRPGGKIGFYVWDYPGGGIEFMRAFWNAAAALDPAAADLTEDKRFPFCTPAGLTRLMADAGFDKIDCTAIEVPTVFRDFEDYWQPFTLGAGPAPSYCVSLDREARQRLEQELRESLPRLHDGSIHLKARAWALKAAVL